MKTLEKQQVSEPPINPPKNQSPNNTLKSQPSQPTIPPNAAVNQIFQHLPPNDQAKLVASAKMDIPNI